jgi:hypothetical protein
MNFKLIAFNARFVHSCLALFYLRSELEMNLPECQSEIMQFTINDPYYPALQRIAANNPEALFFSVYIWNSIYIERLLKDLVRFLPDIPVILGGPQAPALIRNLQSETGQNVTVVQGEIEGVGSVFYEDLGSNRLQPFYICGKSVDFTIPYKQSDFTGPLKNRHIYYESSRGCPFNCTYCLSAAEHGVRYLETDQVFSELTDILRNAPKIIRFVDRTFNDIPDRALEIWRYLLAQPGDTLFHFEMAPDRFTDEIFRFLEDVEPGRFQFEIGIQSTHTETLAAINRKSDKEKFSKDIARLISMDTIHTHLDLILGLPYETKDSYICSFSDVFALAPHYIQMGLLKVLPETPISKKIDEFGLFICKEPPYEILANKWLDKHTLAELFWFGECVEAFYNNRYFRSIWQYLRSREEDIFGFFESLLFLCRGKSFFEKAPTQELLSSLLLDLTRERSDHELFRELLIYDWLRCGHRFIPRHLGSDTLAEQRKLLWKTLPQNLEGVYRYRNRDEFFKQGVFARFSGILLQEAGVIEDLESGYLCFLPVKEATVFTHNRVIQLPEF